MWWKLPALVVIVTLCAACASSGEAGPGASPVNSPTTLADPQAAPPGEAPRRVILFLGDSLSAGYGLDPEQAFPALIQDRIDGQGLPFEVVNAGLSGDTTSGGLARIDWLLKRPVDVLFLELGGNDGLRGISPKVTSKNLQGIIDKTRQSYPEAAVVVAGMLVPPNMGPDYFAQFRSVFPEIASRNNATLIPFLLEGVAGRPELNLPDGIHPTARGHGLVAEHVWGFLKPILEQRL